MRWTKPLNKDLRRRRAFLWRPKRIGREVRWLEWAEWTEQYTRFEGEYSITASWVPQKWHEPRSVPDMVMRSILLRAFCPVRAEREHRASLKGE